MGLLCRVFAFALVSALFCSCSDDVDFIMLPGASTCGPGLIETADGRCSCPTGFDFCSPDPADLTCCESSGGSIVEPGTGACGDGQCGEGEDESNCPADCDFAFCGDGTCGAGEDEQTCALDCDPSLEQRQRLAEALAALETICEEACEVQSACDPEYGYRECYSDCTWLNPYMDVAGLETGINCAETLVALETCLSGLSCSELEAYYQGFEPPYPCSTEEAPYARYCLDIDDASPDDEPYSIIDVTILGAYVAPGKPDQTQWDGPGSVPAEVWSQFLALAGFSSPVTAVGGYIASLAADFLAKPDPKGFVEINTGSGFGNRMELPLNPDTFSPAWRVTYTAVALSVDVRIRVTLSDEDLSEDDPMGTFELNWIDLQRALSSGQVHVTYVGDQNEDRVPWVLLSVTGRD